PLFRSLFSDWGSFGGGKSGLSRIGTHRESDLKGFLSECAKEFADGLLAARNDLAIGSIVDRIGDLTEHRFHLLTHPRDVRTAVQCGHRFHAASPNQAIGPYSF